MNKMFQKFAQKISEATGSSWAFVCAAMAVVIWAISGPIFGFSETWQLVINTGTTIVTFLMVFLIQSTQNRDTKAMQLKLDELLRAVPKARHQHFVDLEDATEEVLARVKEELESECQEGESHEDHKSHGGSDSEKSDRENQAIAA